MSGNVSAPVNQNNINEPATGADKIQTKIPQNKVVKPLPPENESVQSKNVVDVSSIQGSTVNKSYGGADLPPLKSNEQLEKELEDALKDDQFIDGNEYDAIVLQIYATADLEELNKMTPDKKVKLLIELLKDPSTRSEKVLDTVLPFMSAVVIKTAFKFFSVEGLSSTAKKGSLLARTAYELSNAADDALIDVLRVSDEHVLAEASIDTLFQIYRKQQLGDTYFRKLMQQSRGKMGVKEYKKLFSLSAKITTTIYAYSVEAASKIMDDALEKGGLMTKALISQAKALSYDEQKKLMAGLMKHGSIDSGNRVNRFLDRIQHKANIKKTFTDIML